MLVGIAGRQRDLDSGLQSGDPGRDFDHARRIVSNWASRQNEVLGVRPRSVCSSQQAAVWIKRRNWLAAALVHDLRSEARRSLCALIRFSAWPRAQ
jgi:hypothetical protein